MENYSYYRDLNLFFLKEEFDSIMESINSIVMIAALEGYRTSSEQAESNNTYAEHRFAVIDITSNYKCKAFSLCFNYNVVDDNCIFDSIELFYKPPGKIRFTKIIPSKNYRDVFNEVIKLI